MPSICRRRCRKIAVSDLAVRPKQSDVDWITVPSLLVSGTTVDLAKRQAHADSLTLTGVKLVTWLEPDGSLNLLKLMQPPASNAAGAPAQPAPSAATSARGARRRPMRRPPATAPAAAPWKFDLREFALREASISAEDRSTKPAAKVLLAPLSLKVDGVSLDLAKPVTVSPRYADQRYRLVECERRRHAATLVGPIWR